MIEIRWHGRGGQGSFTVAKLLGVASAEFAGKYSMAFPSFGPERRGAPVLGFNRIDDKKITDRSEVETCDYVIVLDETLWGNSVTKGLKKDSVILINTDNVDKYSKLVTNKVIGIDATKLALEILGLPITNTAMLGALIGSSEIIDSKACEKAIEENMNPKIAAKNILLFNQAMKMVKEAQNG
jgi:pyruvate ferredoxin oxidoreductase gamma subunit